LTASVLDDESVPSATPVTARSPAVPLTSTTVPSVEAPMVMGCPAALCCTRPMVPLLIWVCRTLRLLSTALKALATLS